MDDAKRRKAVEDIKRHIEESKRAVKVGRKLVEESRRLHRTPQQPVEPDEPSQSN